MSDTVNNIYANMTMDQLFKEWNESNETYKARQEIRHRLGWRKGLDLWTLIQNYCAQEILDNEDTPITSPSPRISSSSSSTSSRKFGDRRLYELLQNREGKVAVIVQPMLDTGWDFDDIREEGKGRFDRDPDLNRDFLEDMIRQDLYIDEMSDSQVGLLTALFRSWRYWYRRSK